MLERALSLSDNVIQFCRFLRKENFAVSIHEEVSTLRALSFFRFDNSNDFFLLLQSTLCKSYAELQAFGELYKKFWKEKDRLENAKEKFDTQAHKNKRPFKSLKSWLDKGNQDATEETATYSYHEVLSKKNFDSINSDQVYELMRIIKALSKSLATRVGRRYDKTNRVHRLDVRRILRRNMRSGGELIEIYFKKHRTTRTKLVILCDVSKSMDLYSSFLLQFIYSFQQVYRHLEAFTFGTSLQRITGVIKQNGTSRWTQSLAAASDSWSGGTRIGKCFNSFISEYGSTVLTKRSIIMILSDGWDTGDIDLLKSTMEQIQKRSKKVIWLNPLAGYVSYSSDTAGLKAALPFVDVFAPVHNADSLRSLIKWL